MAGGPPLVRRAGVQVRRRARSVFDLPGDRSRRGIKSCNPKNQIWDESRNKWYLSHSGCGIKSGIHTTFLGYIPLFVSRVRAPFVHGASVPVSPKGCYGTVTWST